MLKVGLPPGAILVTAGVITGFAASLPGSPRGISNANVRSGYDPLTAAAAFDPGAVVFALALIFGFAASFPGSPLVFPASISSRISLTILKTELAAASARSAVLSSIIRTVPPEAGMEMEVVMSFSSPGSREISRLIVPPSVMLILTAYVQPEGLRTELLVDGTTIPCLPSGPTKYPLASSFPRILRGTRIFGPSTPLYFTWLTEGVIVTVPIAGTMSGVVSLSSESPSI